MAYCHKIVIYLEYIHVVYVENGHVMLMMIVKPTRKSSYSASVDRDPAGKY